jgi:hypothetical protein
MIETQRERVAMKKYKLKRTVTSNDNYLYKGAFVYHYPRVSDHGASAADTRNFQLEYISVTSSERDFSVSFSVPIDALSYVSNDDSDRGESLPVEYAASHFKAGVLLPTPKAQPSPAYAAPTLQAPVMPTAAPAPAPAPVPMAPAGDWNQGTPPPAPAPASAPAQVPLLRDESPAPAPDAFTKKLYLNCDCWPMSIGDAVFIRDSDWLRIGQITTVDCRHEGQPLGTLDRISTLYLTAAKPDTHEEGDLNPQAYQPFPQAPTLQAPKAQQPTLRDYQIAPEALAPIPASQLIRETFADTSVGTDYKGHQTLAHMIQHHIHNYEKALKTMEVIQRTGGAEDEADWWAHERQALEEIKLAVLTDVKEYESGNEKQTLTNAAKADAERCVREAVNTLNNALVHMSYT